MISNSIKLLVLHFGLILAFGNWGEYKYTCFVNIKIVIVWNSFYTMHKIYYIYMEYYSSIYNHYWNQLTVKKNIYGLIDQS